VRRRDRAKGNKRKHAADTRYQFSAIKPAGSSTLSIHLGGCKKNALSSSSNARIRTEFLYAISRARSFDFADSIRIAAIATRAPIPEDGYRRSEKKKEKTTIGLFTRRAD